MQKTLAGLALGPTGLGVISTSENVALLAELGVVVLLFFIGMELSLKAFVNTLKPAMIIAGVQLAAAIAIGQGNEVDLSAMAIAPCSRSPATSSGTLTRSRSAVSMERISSSGIRRMNKVPSGISSSKRSQSSVEKCGIIGHSSCPAHSSMLMLSSVDCTQFSC